MNTQYHSYPNRFTSDDVCWVQSLRVTEQGCRLFLEPGIRAATAQPNNRKRRLGLRLLSLPEGDRARERMGTNTAFGTRTAAFPAKPGRTEATVPPLEVAIINDEVTVKRIAEGP